MPDIELHIDQIFDGFNAFSLGASARAKTIVRKTTMDVKAKYLKSLSGPRTGREYKRGRKKHQASAPGEAPATDSGDLAKSVQTEFPDLINGLTGLVEVTSDHAALLEYGTAKMAARPALGPAVEAAADDFTKALQGIITE